MFAHNTIRRACYDVDIKNRAVLLRFIDTNADTSDVRILLERMLLAFDVCVVYRVLEQVKAIVWALVRTVYARNINLLSLNRHLAHLEYAKSLLTHVTQPKPLFEFTRHLYKRYCVYELAEDSLTWDELIDLLCKLNLMFDVIKK